MNDLPFVDEHRLTIEAPPDRVWAALLLVLRSHLGGRGPVPLARILRVEPSELIGDWRVTPRTGDSLPGFEVTECVVPTRLVLRGRHRFSHYSLVFDLSPSGDEKCTLSATTRAAFPGLDGRGYRALVIGSGGHRVLVRRMLRTVARRS